MSHWRLAIGGTTPIDEGHSDGTAGPLDHLLLFWWDKEAKTYRLFVCFKDQGSACRVGGTAHWEGDTFVNDYEETVHGKLTEKRRKATPFRAGDIRRICEAKPIFARIRLVLAV